VKEEFFGALKNIFLYGAFLPSRKKYFLKTKKSS